MRAIHRLFPERGRRLPPFPHLFTPITIGGITLPNRIMMGSMHTNLEGRGDAPARLAAFYGARAKGGAGLIVTGGWSPNEAGRLTSEPTAFSRPAQARAHRTITAAVHDHGGRILLQLVHGGRYCYHDAPVAPSPLRSPINRETPRQLSAADIGQTIADFAAAAALAVDAGYDGVEIMGSEGYLITQFLAPRTNRRTDEWGGSLENRARFALEIIARVRAALGPGPILMFRISALDLIEDGLSARDTVWLARACQQAGADVLDTGIGWHEVRIPTIAAVVPRAGFAFAAKRIKEAVTIPVIATNRINTPEAAERLIASGAADMVALARPLLADADFAAKAQMGEPDRINTCIACNQACLDHYFTGAAVSCLVNPQAGHERTRALTRAAKPKRIAIAGAGPAGLSAAIALARRGHAVALFEAGGQIGGQFNLARNVPSKEDFGESLRYWAHALDDLGVTVHLNQPANAERLGAGFDEIIVATGVSARTRVIEGEDHPMAATYGEILSGKKTAGRRVAIVGAGGIGFDVALFLAKSGARDHLEPDAFRRHWGIEQTQEPQARPPVHDITMLQRSPGRFGASLGKSTGWVHKLELARAGVRQIAGVTYERIDDRGLHILRDGVPQVIAADAVILCAGQAPHDPLSAPLKKTGMPVHVIGGAREAAGLDAKRAIAEAFDLAMSL